MPGQYLTRCRIRPYLAGHEPDEDTPARLFLCGSVYVPPPPNRVLQLLSDLEKYIHADDSLPKLVRIGLLQVQFETIHPYLDGNGRIGRLLFALLLEHWRLLEQPLLYISLFFKRHREEYYRRLNLVRLEGDWEGWLDSFLDGVATISYEAVASARELFALVARDRANLLAAEGASISTPRLFEQLPRHPIITVSAAMKLINVSKPTATRAIESLADVNILVETTGKKRDRRLAYRAYLEHLRTGTELDL
jgi:Fic family protein